MKQGNFTFDLPNGSQWEKAGRSVDARFLPWGDEIDALHAQTLLRCKLLGTIEREMLRESDLVRNDISLYGISGMGGNVSEWTSETDPFGAFPEKLVGIRGGRGNAPPERARSAMRASISRNHPRLSHGFRLCMIPEMDSN